MGRFLGLLEKERNTKMKVLLPLIHVYKRDEVEKKGDWRERRRGRSLEDRAKESVKGVKLDLGTPEAFFSSLSMFSTFNV